MNATIIFIVGLIVGAIIAEVINIFFIPIKKWIYSEEEEYCTFHIKGTHNLTGNPIKITKRFRKIKSINCGYFTERKLIEDNNMKYLHCYYGKHVDIIKRSGGYCPFDIKSVKMFKNKKSA